MSRRMRKADVEARGPNAALNVKDYGRYGDTLATIEKQFQCSEADAERALDFAIDSAKERFWEDARVDAKDIFDNVQVYSEGRCGGWLVIHGLPLVEDWNAVQLGKWAKFCRNCQEAMEYLRSCLLEDIEANRWAEPGSQLFNFIDTKDGRTVAMPDLHKVQADAADKFLAGD